MSAWLLLTSALTGQRSRSPHVGQRVSLTGGAHVSVLKSKKEKEKECCARGLDSLPGPACSPLGSAWVGSIFVVGLASQLGYGPAFLLMRLWPKTGSVRQRIMGRSPPSPSSFLFLLFSSLLLPSRPRVSVSPSSSDMWVPLISISWIWCGVLPLLCGWLLCVRACAEAGAQRTRDVAVTARGAAAAPRRRAGGEARL
jgi:hypothetical protein